LKTLRVQLKREGDLLAEYDATIEMNRRYKNRPKKENWHFEEVLPSPNSTQSRDLLWFTPLLNTVVFEDLSEADKKIVSSMIVDADLDFLLSGEFDADSQVRNFRFDPRDPTNKRIYRLDGGQGWKLKKTSLSHFGDGYYIAQIFTAFAEKDPAKRVSGIVRAFTDITRADGILIPEGAIEALEKDVATFVNGELDDSLKLMSIMGNLNKHKVLLPDRISLGVVKALLIVKREKYAEYVPAEFYEKKFRDYVIRENLKAVPAKIIQTCNGFFDASAKAK
jgi:hypothetical protein